MKNKFYLTKTKTRQVFFGLSLLLFGLFASSLQAQNNYTHSWKAGVTGDWNVASNWDTYSLVTQTNTITASSTTTVTLVAANTIAVGDYITGGNILGEPIVTAVSGTGAGATVTFAPALATAPTVAALTYTFSRYTITTSTVPGSASLQNVKINNGVCTLTANPTNAIRVLSLGNTATAQGKLIINSGVNLTVNNAGNGGNGTVIGIRGGVIENNGTITGISTVNNGGPIKFEPAFFDPSSDWGIIGSGNLVLSNTNTTNPTNVGFIQFSNTTSTTLTPKVIANGVSTVSLAAQTTTNLANPYAIINLAANAKGRIEGTGFTTISTFKPALFTSSSGSVLDIAAGVSLPHEIVYTRTTDDVSGTINNQGTIINRALLKVATAGLINNTGAGTIINKALTPATATNMYIFTPSSATLGALAVGDTYTVGGVTYTIAFARAANAATSVLIVTTAPTFSKPPTSGSLSKGTSVAGSSSMAYTAVANNSYGGYITNTNSISNVTQERYLSSNQRGWRLLSNPFTTSTTFGTVATSSATPLTLGNGTAKTYNPVTNTWTISNTDNTQSWASRSAISLFVRGRTSEVTSNSYSVSPPSNVTISVTGTASNTAPSGIATTASRYYLVANPYTAPVSVSAILTASTGLSSTISYYNPTNGSSGSNADLILKYGGYNTISVSGAAGSATDVVIPPLGAFFVQASTAGTINIPKTAIFNGVPAQTATYNHRLAQTTVASSVLKLEVKSDNTYYDAVALRFKAVGDASSNVDFGKLPNEILDAYSIAGSNKMAVSELELAVQTIPLGITSTIQKSYTFKVAENTIPSGYEAVLVDTYLNINTVLAAGTYYAFAIDTNPASQGDARFAISLRTASTLAVVANDLDSKIQLWPNPARSEVNITNGQSANDGVSSIEISNLNGQLIHSQKSNPGTTTTIQTKGWSTGVYILRATNNGTETTKKLIIQ